MILPVPVDPANDTVTASGRLLLWTLTRLTEAIIRWSGSLMIIGLFPNQLARRRCACRAFRAAATRR
jgi:hypothetical protein